MLARTALLEALLQVEKEPSFVTIHDSRIVSLTIHDSRIVSLTIHDSRSLSTIHDSRIVSLLFMIVSLPGHS